jgi:mevalonate kinase
MDINNNFFSENINFELINHMNNINSNLNNKLDELNSKLLELDNILSKDSRVLSHKLCGAGNGGYFLIFASKNVNLNNYYPMMKPISVSKEGLNYTILGNESTRI